VTEDKLCLFLEQEVVNRESRASGYQKQKAKRIETWKDTERERRGRGRQLRGGAVKAGGGEEEGGGEEWDEEALDAMFKETIRYSVVSSYASAITKLYVWQFEGKPAPPLRGAKLSAVLESIRRDEDRIR